MYEYCKYNTEFKFELFLVNGDKLRKCLTQFRLSSHNLRKHNSDYPLIIYELKLVGIVMNHEKIDCVSVVYYSKRCWIGVSLFTLLSFVSLFKTKTYRQNENIRSWPNENKFIKIMSSKSIANLIKISRFINESTNLRKIAIENMPVS